MDSAEQIIYKIVAEKKISPQEASLILDELEKKTNDDDIAVIGMALRLPKADTVDEYWENLINGVNCIDRFPQTRRKDAYILADSISEVDDDPFLDGGYLKEIDKFDAVFFRLSPQGAKLIDPCHRIFLLTAWEAFEDAGYTKEQINGTHTGVYVGIDLTYKSEYSEKALDAKMDFAARTASWSSVLAGRVAHALNLNGPTIVVDTACSAGLVSVHMASNALNRGECTLAIAGGVNFLYAPTKSNALSTVQSGGSQLIAFDKNSKGTIWGEGSCALLLKTLKNAIEDRDNIHAVIKGSAINNDGATGAITAPSAEAQEDVLTRAWQFAKIAPETISYIEAHGTGTELGDPIELKGITRAFQKYTSRKQFCGIGSVKTNIGHNVAASGIASMIKVICAMKYGIIPATIHFKEPNPFINFCDSPVYINEKKCLWETNGFPKRAGVSAFGFSGTNSHVVLEEAPLREIVEHAHSGEKRVMTISAKNENTLKKFVTRYLGYLEKHKEINFDDMCYTAVTGRGHYDYRIALVIENKKELVEKLSLIKRSTFKELNDKDIYYNFIKIAREDTKQKKPDEITGEEIQQNSQIAEKKISELLSDSLSISKKNNILHEICRLYIKGADIDWKNLYKNEERYKISLPGYPLKQKRCWIEIDTPKNEDTKKLVRTHYKDVHPLLGQLITDNIFNVIYESELSPQTHWVLSDHKILQKNVLPGTAYIEIAQKACNLYFNTGDIELQDITFFSPVMLNPDDKKILQTIITKKDKNYIEFLMCSKYGDEWVRHCEGKALKITKKKIKIIDIKKIKKHCPTQINGSAIKEKTDVSEFGPRWNTVSEVHSGPEELLITLVLPEELHDDLTDHYIHAALLDNAINISIRMNDNENYYLPFSFKSIKIYERIPAKFYSYVKNKVKLSEGKEIITFTIILLDTQGKVFIEIKDYTIKKVPRHQFRFRHSDIYFKTVWVAHELSKNTKATDTRGVIIFKDEKQIGDRLIKILRGKGHTIIEVAAGDSLRQISENSFCISNQESDYQKLLAIVSNMNISLIIHLFTITKQNDIDNLNSMEESQNRGIYSFFWLIRALIANRYNNPLDIVLVSEYAYFVKKDQEKIYAHNMAFFGLGKAVNYEYLNIKCRCIDLDKNGNAEQIIDELATEEYNYSISYRNGVRYREEFRKYNIEFIQDRKFEVKAGGTYLLTGGLGGIGLETCKYLASHNHVTLCLVNRSQIPERINWDKIIKENTDKKLCQKIKYIRELESMGSKTICYRADVADLEAMKRVINDIRKKYGSIRGVFHCAGVAGDSFIIRKDEEAFKKVIQPKMQGTWIIDTLTRQDNPDIFVLYSSIFTLQGGPGQGDYCAANSFLDSFVFQRNRKGGKTITINWPGWNETGMAVDYGADKTSGIFKTISTKDAINAFDEILNRDIERIFVGEFDFEAIRFIIDSLNIHFSPDIQLLIDKKIKIRETGGSKKYKDILITGKDEDELTEYEKTIGTIWAHILDLDEINVYNNFQDLGGDSIMATYILKEMEKYYPGNVNIADIFSYPTVNALAKHLDKKINKTEKFLIVAQEENIDDLLDKVSTGNISSEAATELFQTDE